jgi:Rad3-related DNA helicase
MGRANWDLFLDEAHRMPEELSNLISVTVSKWVRKHYELPEFPEITESGEKRQKAIRTAYDWLGRCVALMTRWCNVRDEQKALKAKRFQANLKQLQDVLGDAQPGTWYIQSNKELFSAKPVVPGIYANKLIANQARSLTLMSATIGDADTLLDELGLGNMEYQFISLPHAFPQENRPVLWVQSAPRMRNRTTEAEYKYQAQLISGIIQQHKGEKGLIHTASWHHAKALMEYLSNNGVGDRMMLAGGNRIETVEQFKLSAPGTVAVSPSWREGLNFPDDECRFCVMAKTPFLSLTDPIIRMRLAQDGGNRWYKWKAALQVVQALGRGVRHADDWCINYIVDGTWPQVAPYVPKWFHVDTI